GDAMLTGLGAAFGELRDDAATRVVIVTGAPPVFSAGADAPLSSKMTPDERRRAFAQRKSQFRRLFERANTLLENLEQPTIAMINGHAIGGGWGLTLACDFRWAATEAEFWIPEVDLGVPLGVASTTRFVRLVGIRILELSRVIAGPYCATLMADLGADVVKVERPGRGDDLRAWRGDGMSATFAAINRNKRGIAVDLQHPEGARLVLELARRV